MTGKRRLWSEEETKGLYHVLDKNSNEGSISFAQSVTKIQQHLLKSREKGNSQLSETQVKAKLRGLGQKVGVSAEKLVSGWRRHRQQLVPKRYHQQSTSPSSRSPSLRGRNSDPPQDPEQPSNDSPIPAPPDDNRSSPSGENPLGSPSRVANESNKSPPVPYDLVTRILYRAQIPGYDSIDDALNSAWRGSFESRKYTSGLSTPDAFHALAGAVLDIERGVSAFVTGFPVAHLTPSNLTRASLNLGETLCGIPDRSYVENTLKVLLANPFMNTEIILRAFAGVAMFAWAFGDASCPLHVDRPNPLPKPINGNLLKFCEEYLPLFAASMKQEENLSYLDLVIKPMIPELARRFARDLSDVFQSLCVSPAPPIALIQWQRDTAEAQGADEEGVFDYRLGFQMKSMRYFEEAFLQALKFDMRMRTADPEYKFETKWPRIGVEFKHESMTPAHKNSDGRKLTEENTVTLALCPALWRTYGTPENRKRHCLHKALVIVEGFGMDEFALGYPPVVDLP
ncbi:hypothetical protein AYL99_00596 [Fonsecaea erecta]|uniref:Uncharacterized protein n=1 Tax=Fonsecaea erecta TaxID=1367422 RepID=A0A178ZXU7_9EURO|nr:hypothetical protein AYL99_00596 [Fonsecaea erecta]OAP64624.1 hypothetical protein AYL99_00596 [Fonsecaea erecta]